VIKKGIADSKITKNFRLERSNTNLRVTENQKEVIISNCLFVFQYRIILSIPKRHQKSITLFGSILVKALLTIDSNYFTVESFDYQNYMVVIINVFMKI
jgi:hypothetical protein